MPAKIWTTKRPSFCSTLNTGYYSSFVKLLILVIQKNPLYKSEDTLTIHDNSSLSSSLRSCMHLTCVFECLYLNWPFWTKINRIYKRDFQVCPRKQLATYWTGAKNNLHSNANICILITFIQLEHFLN